MEPAKTSLELRPPTAPDALLPKQTLPPWAIAMIVVGVLLLGFVLVRLFTRKRIITPATLRQRAYLEALRTMESVQASNGREAATVSSLVLRRYLSTVTGDPTLFETHEEFVSRHDALTSLPEPARVAAVEGFDRLASLKYARGTGSEAPAPVIESSRALLETLHHAFA
jgi:hypothetical protein